jgi:LysR family glycine cleavage system transcriptional activator
MVEHDPCAYPAPKASRTVRRQLPPLNAVRAFEAAARTGGFQAAASELNVSANAIGRLVKVLEDWLGTPLFKRLPRGVVVTELGYNYLARVETLLDQIAEATAEVQRREDSRVLTVAAGPSFVARWLIPRLGCFTRRNPGLELRLLASARATDFSLEDVDIAIQLGWGNFDGSRRDLLMGEEHYPVCAPLLLSRGPRLREPGDLAHHVLLHTEHQFAPDQLDWAGWLAAVGVKGIDAQRGLRFHFAYMTLAAAVAGQGVALASSALIADDLEAGRLVRPFHGLALEGPYGIYMIYPQATAVRQKIVAFREWALEEAHGAHPQI